MKQKKYSDRGRLKANDLLAEEYHGMIMRRLHSGSNLEDLKMSTMERLVRMMLVSSDSFLQVVVRTVMWLH
jgi:hypothetical protein